MISRHDYTKSTFSMDTNCVEVRLLIDGTVGVRDSKDRSKPPHVFTSGEWSAFVAGVRAGDELLVDGIDLAPEGLQGRVRSRLRSLGSILCHARNWLYRCGNKASNQHGCGRNVGGTRLPAAKFRAPGPPPIRR